MMTFFPTIYEDEILYSALARYHIRSGNVSLKATLEDIYGKKSVTSVMELPSNINSIIDNITFGNEYTADIFINENTLYPFYSAFLPLEDAEYAKKSMKGNGGGSIYNKVGLMASSITLDQHFKFCPQCIKEDKERYGELYWHRVHQITGVLICPKHKELLHYSKVPVRGANKHEYRITDIDNCKINNDLPNYSEEVIEKLTLIAEDAEYLLNNKFENKSREWFLEQYICKLKELGLANINDRINQKELLARFVDYYGDNLLKILQSDIDPSSSWNWLNDIVRRSNKTSHPIRHLLMARFLGLTIEDLFYKKLEYKPFGDGPWPCLNAAAEHYLESVVTDIKINYSTDTKYPMGTFTCSCGFVFVRKGPDLTQDSRNKLGRVKVYGAVWEKKLEELINKKLSLRETARRLNVDPATVKKYAKKLGLETHWVTRTNKEIILIQNNENINDQEEEKRNKRKQWKTLMQQYPQKSKTELRKINKGLYIWLYRNDKEWLNNNSPDKKSTANTNLRVDWMSRDEEILVKVKAVVNDMISSTDKPERITTGAVGRKIGVKALLEKHLDKIPGTKAYLDSVRETQKQFHIRKIKWAIKELKKEEEDLVMWRIFRKAGIREEYQKELGAVVNELI